MTKKWTLLCLLLLHAGYLPAQETGNSKPGFPLVFRHLTKADGLASNVVNAIIQDRRGFMWFGTDKGLNRYDGRSFVLFSRHTKDTNSLSGNNITALFEDSKGRLWIGTNGNGITVYNPVTERFTRYEHNEQQSSSINTGYVAQVYEDGAGRIWICLYGGGLELFDEKTGKFIHHTWRANDSTSIAGNKVKSIYELSPGKYLVGTFEAGGDINHDLRDFGCINYYDLSTNSFKPVHIGEIMINRAYKHRVFIMERLVHTIMRDSAGYIWFGTYAGILRYNPLTGHSIAYKHSDDDSATLSNDIVRSISELDGRIYFGTEGGGLNILDTGTGKFVHYKNNPLNPNSLSDDFIKAVCRDRDKRIWIGTLGGGINIIDPVNGDFKVYPYQHLKILQNTRLEDVTIHAICPAGKNTLLIGSGTGLTILNTITDEVKLVQKKYTNDSRIINSPVFTIYPSVMGHFWVCIHNSIYKFNPKTQALLYYDAEVYKQTKPLAILSIVEADDSSLLVNAFGKFTWRQLRNNSVDSISNRIKAIIVKDKEGDIWARYYFKDNSDGVIKISKDWQIKQYNYTSDNNFLRAGRISNMYVDYKNRLWVSGNTGLYRLDKKTGKFIRYKNIVNFPDSSINCMTGDGDNNMWFLTNDALIRMDSSGRITTYETYKDIPVHKPESKMVYDEKEDAIYFAANEGLVKFYPRKLKLHKETQPIFITGFKLFNKELPTDTSLLLKKIYHFSHDENMITINFTAINYSNRVSTQYSYKLEGLNKDWVNIGNSHEANFTNLNPGVYVFRVRGSSHEGIWNYESEPFTITIDKPWWSSSWFYTGCGIMLIFSVWGYNRYRTNIFTRQTRKLEQTVEERTAQYKLQKEKAEKSERLRQQFLANMSHEIRTPMNAVSGITHLLLEKDPKPEQVRYLQAISKSSDVLLHIINDILDLSKIEAGKLEPETIDFSVRTVIDKVMGTLSYSAEKKSLQFKLSVGDDVPREVIGDPFRLSQVLFNLCGNAIKFTETGSVYLEVTKANEDAKYVFLKFNVRDTGIGIAEDKLQQLFKDFAQVNISDTRTHGGTGLGLSISKNLVELMGGEIEVESRAGYGSSFSFILPFGRLYTAAVEHHTETEKKIDGSMLNGLRILLADDNEYNRMVVLEILNLKAEVYIDTAITGEEAVTLMKNNNYDIVLMDIQMPVMSGIEATKIIRGELSFPKNKVPVIALTASTQRSDIESCMQAGMNTYVTKPFVVAQLINTIAEVTGRKNNSAITDINEPIKKSDTMNTLKNTVTDISYLYNFCESDKGRIKQYILLYLQAVPVFNQKMTNALIDRDYETISALVHSFKPKCQMMGMSHTHGLTISIEEACEDRNESVFALVRSLLEETETSVTELREITLH